MPYLKESIRKFLNRRGWFLRRTAGLPIGVDFRHDWTVRAGLPLPRLIVDVGAHRGETCLAFARAFPGAHIHAFEPVSDNFAALTHATRSLTEVTRHQLALGARSETVAILLQPDSQTHSLRHRVPPRAPTANDASETIRVTTLDAFAADSAIGRIDLLKIDTEGHEIAVLEGASRLLAAGAVGPVYLEATLDPDDTEHTQLADVTACLARFGYRLAGLYEQVLWSSPSRLAYFNALFLPR